MKPVEDPGMGEGIQAQESLSHLRHKLDELDLLLSVDRTDREKTPFAEDEALWNFGFAPHGSCLFRRPDVYYW